MENLFLRILDRLNLNTTIKLLVIAVLFMAFIVLFNLNNKLNSNENNSMKIKVEHEQVNSIAK